jgi:hypothetical protein
MILPKKWLGNWGGRLFAIRRSLAKTKKGDAGDADDA